MTDVVLEARTSPEDLLPGKDQPASATYPPRVGRSLVTAWLLLLLERQPAHGYELRRQLDAHGVQTEGGAMYRTLRKLEEEGWTASTWADSLLGPRRRQYQITAKGRRELAKRVAQIACTHDVEAAFLRVCLSADDHEVLSAYERYPG